MEKSGENHNNPNRVTMLKKRRNRCVCKFCGNQLRLKRIIFSNYEEARIEIFCPNCNRIEFGVEPEIYASAKYFVEQTEFNYYQDLDENERTKQMNIAKICEILDWGSLNLGIMNKEGFTVPLNMNENFLGKCIVLTDADLNYEEETEEEKEWENDMGLFGR